MAVGKFYAVWRQGERQQLVNAFQAKRLADQATILTSPKDKAVLYDLETDLKVFPVWGQRKQAYFRYYPDEDSPLKGQPGSFEYSPELIVFLEVFSNIKQFRLSEYGDDKTVFTIYPDRIKRFARVTFDDGFAIVKCYMTLSETKPYSEFYRLNGQLALEFKVTSQATPIKRKELGLMGIPLFEAQAKVPKCSVPADGYDSEEKLTQVVSDVKKTYETTTYRLLGTYRNTHIITKENQRKYQILKTFEDQCAELTQEIEALKKQLEMKQEKVSQLDQEIFDSHQRLQTYRRQEDRYRQLDSDNFSLRQDRQRLDERCQSLLDEKSRLTSTLSDTRGQLSYTQEKLDSFYQAGFLQRLKEVFIRKS